MRAHPRKSRVLGKDCQMIATGKLTGVFVSVFFYSGRSPCKRRFSNLKPRPRCVRVRKLAGHLACPWVFPRTAADDARLPATRTCPVGHRRPRGLFVRLQRVRGEYARGCLSSLTPSNGCTKTDNGGWGCSTPCITTRKRCSGAGGRWRAKADPPATAHALVGSARALMTLLRPRTGCPTIIRHEFCAPP